MNEPINADLHSVLQAGLRAHQAGQLADAKAAYEQVLAAQPNHADASHLLGIIAHQGGDHETAVTLIGTAIGLNPAVAAYHSNLGNALLAQGRASDAAASYGKALAISPGDAEIHANLGAALVDAGDMDGAAASYRKALALNPNNAETHVNLGNALKDLGRLDDAIASYRKGLALAPDMAGAHTNLGLALHDQDHLEDAIASHLRALAINPDYAEAHSNLGKTLKEAGRLEDAIASHRRALAINPGLAEAHGNLGNALKELGRWDAALASYHAALIINPDYAEAHNNLGMLQLAMGDFPDGWKNYAWRRQVKDFTNGHRKNIYTAPFWTGEKLAGEKILIRMEQGIGDEIMFASMLPDLAKISSAIVVQCDKRLLPLFERSFPEISFLDHPSSPADESIRGGFDVQFLAGDMGAHFRTHIDAFPKRPEFIYPNKENQSRMRNDYAHRWPGKFLVGVSWRSGNAKAGMKRSVSLDQLRSLLANADCQFINLQYGDVVKDLANFKNNTGLDIFQDGNIDPLQDMDGFAAQIAALDLVISIDNSTVHLAGALGIPTWTLLPDIPDWRWMVEGQGSPWYPALRLFRQQERNDWTRVIDNIRGELEKLVENLRN